MLQVTANRTCVNSYNMSLIWTTTTTTNNNLHKSGNMRDTTLLLTFTYTYLQVIHTLNKYTTSTCCTSAKYY